MFACPSVDGISNFTASGQSWLQHGTILNMEIKCKGSPPLQYCSRVFKGKQPINSNVQVFCVYSSLPLVASCVYFAAPYNITGNEGCVFYSNLSTCRFPYTRYFNESKTVLFFLRNEVSSTVNKVTINIYEGEHNSFIPSSRS